MYSHTMAPCCMHKAPAGVELQVFGRGDAGTERGPLSHLGEGHVSATQEFVLELLLLGLSGVQKHLHRHVVEGLAAAKLHKVGYRQQTAAAAADGQLEAASQEAAAAAAELPRGGHSCCRVAFFS